MNILPKIIAWILIFYGAYCLFVFLMQRSIIFPRHQIPLSSGTANQIAGLEKKWLQTEFGKIETWYVPATPGSRTGPAPAVIFAHGNAELIDYWPEEFQKFSRMGIALLLVEYPGYGRSSGTPSQASITDTFVAAYDALISRKDVDPSRVVLLGRSLGGGAVCSLARQRPSAALILMSTFKSIPSMASRFLVPKFLVRDPFDNLEALKGYQKPVLVIHGRHDNIIPYDHGTHLHRAAQNSQMVTYDCGHNDCPPDWDRFWEDIVGFLRDHGIVGVTGGRQPDQKR